LRPQSGDPAVLYRPQQARILARARSSGADRRDVLVTALGASVRATSERAAKTFELDTWNCGNPLVGWLDTALRLLSQFIPDYPPPIPITEKYRRRDWL
jgi:hypothetical protein